MISCLIRVSRCEKKRQMLSRSCLQYVCFICSVLNDHERKKLIIQLELLYPEKSYILEILERFRGIIKNEQDRVSKASDFSCVQLLFSFTVFLSDNTYIMKKYCNYIIEIAYEHITWALQNSSSSLSSSLDICSAVFSVWIHQVFHLESIQLLGVSPAHCDFTHHLVS